MQVQRWKKSEAKLRPSAYFDSAILGTGFRLANALFYFGLLHFSVAREGAVGCAALTAVFSHESEKCRENKEPEAVTVLGGWAARHLR